MSAVFEEIDIEKARQIIESRPDVVVLDVRNADEFWGELGHIKGAIHIPIDTLPMNLDRLEGFQNREIVCVCYTGPRSRLACQVLAANGFKKLYNMIGGMGDWGDANWPVEGQNQWPRV
jgi:rhodanese-related sulfurtransferase